MTDNPFPEMVAPSAKIFAAPRQGTAPEPIDYRYSEDKFMAEARAHIDKTYGAHYSGEIQTTEYIMSNASSLDFLSGSVQAYIARFGKKNGYNVEDLWKAVHFIAMMAHFAEKKFK